ncbi:ATP-binding protein [Halocatena halophila]|uniref:ATP-binding protein n=1 Tax=Halocatena halophila TaxID=2814576 RepID=UPI002ED67873
MSELSLPHEARAGPTKPPVRAVVMEALGVGPPDHFVDVGSCTGAMTIEGSLRTDLVTAIERDPDRVRVTERNLRANDATEGVTVLNEEAPAGLPPDGDVLFIGGSREFDAVLEQAIEYDYDRIGMTVSRLEVAGKATTAFKERGLLSELLQLQVSQGYELAGAMSFRSNNPVFFLLGEPS